MKLPKDARGVEIPLSTEELFDKNGNVVKVQGYEFFPRSGHWNLELFCNPNSSACTEEFYIEKPESWEEIEEDLLRFANVKDVDYMPCAYVGVLEEERCIGSECRLYESEKLCIMAMMEDIAHRINNLRNIEKLKEI